MKFRYYIADPFDGAIVGTESEEVAKQFAASEDFFVIDSETGMSLLADGSIVPIEVVKHSA